MAIYSITSSCGHSLRLHTATELDKYQKEQHEIIMKYYAREVHLYGIYASNQDCYVQSEADLNDWDSKTMYNWYKEWKEDE